jgi:hypothetical protein
VDGNFPKIIQPIPEDVFMLDCIIDVEDKEMPIDISEVKQEVLKFFYTDHHPVYVRIIKHF